MGNKQHIEMLHKGARTWNEWRSTIPGIDIDLSGADFLTRSYRGIDLSYVNLKGAKLRDAKLHEADLQYAILDEVVLCGANLTEANLTGASLIRADMMRITLASASLYQANLTDAKIDYANLSKTNLFYADLTGVNLQKSDLIGCNLISANMQKANIQNTVIRDCEIGETCVYKIKNADKSLIKGNLIRKHPSWLFYPEKDNVKPYLKPSFYYSYLPRYIFRWELISVLGKLRLFTLSYLALVAIPIVVYFISRWNHLMGFGVNAASSFKDQPETQILETPHWVLNASKYIVENKSEVILDVPSNMMTLFYSTLLLAIGTTLYSFCCPSRIKQFTKDQWCDELQRDEIEYTPLNWNSPVSRIVCWLSYTFGGALAVLYMVPRLYDAFKYIKDNSGLW